MDASYYIKNNPFKREQRSNTRVKSAGLLLGLGALTFWMLDQSASEMKLQSVRMPEPKKQLLPLDTAPAHPVGGGISSRIAAQSTGSQLPQATRIETNASAEAAATGVGSTLSQEAFNKTSTVDAPALTSSQSGMPLPTTTSAVNTSSHVLTGMADDSVASMQASKPSALASNTSDPTSAAAVLPVEARVPPLNSSSR
mmetsp:Transcript_11759/g.27185  ORF Transcript_11759/g.27185 Transcript_11759/m.27185 type:complete len:198 (-) Transcript_11759:568-1161(-)|eukprot:CAMPEP_0119370588 /NCGR_PEP_ID=MMETSP1334-20130426/16934_1 /TAXON_ID=127549 /ORGANISM="Calcidiscus leptoporus, Strain RCC1130" /LENGTH=197 /DNA_ID=CAMNT_0007387681 /DNA_START=61 /DNA_END=654 /DNA_ORIENTATION=-